MLLASVLVTREAAASTIVWTLVEAVPLRVLCPWRLGNLYATVGAIGDGPPSGDSTPSPDTPGS